jgi:hypothetical protein
MCGGLATDDTWIVLCFKAHFGIGGVWPSTHARRLSSLVDASRNYTYLILMGFDACWAFSRSRTRSMRG